MNRWNIPDWLATEIVERDKCCVYCGVVFGLATSKGCLPSWEHIVNDARIITSENIALSCRSCNASKGAKLLTIWLESAYCKQRNIGPETVAEVVKAALIRPLNFQLRHHHSISRREFLNADGVASCS
jgi:hypothetical protein